MNGEEYLLEMKNINKTFSGTTVLNNVNINIKKGEVHSLVGENGAGKSTLMKVLLGIYKPDQGSITYKGEKVTIDNPRKALDLGISMIHQELNLIEERTIAENIWIGREPRKSGFINWNELFAKTKSLLEKMELPLDPKQTVKSLSVGNKQLIEILKAITFNSDLIMMDEPTSALSEKEVELLFKIIAELKSNGVSIIYISHKFDELYRIADRATVLRDGQAICTRDMGRFDRNELITMLVGRELSAMFPKVETSIGDIALEVKGLKKNDVYENISFHVRTGEILGIAGLMGSGRTEIMRGIFGLDIPDNGEIFINRKKVAIRSPSEAIQNGIAFVTEDRKKEGLVPNRSVKENISMVNLMNICNSVFIDNSREKRHATEYIQKLLIKTSSHQLAVGSLSGGNQQKVIIGKWLSMNPKILILDEPTRGIDVAAKSEIYKLISELAQQGMAIILVSSELPEILGMSDRILVLNEGRAKGVLTRNEASQETIMKLAVGD